MRSPFADSVAGPILNIAGWITAIVIIVNFVLPMRARFPSDFFMAWGAAQAMTTMPLTNIYAPEQKRQIVAEMKRRGQQIPTRDSRITAVTTYINVTATPLHYTLQALASSGDFKRDYIRYQVASALAWSLGILALAWCLGFPGPVAAALLWMFTQWYFPFRGGVSVSNLSVLHAGLFTLALVPLRFPKPACRFLSGFCLAYLAAVKPTLIAAGPLIVANMALQRRWTDAAWVTAGGVVGGLLALATPALCGVTNATWTEFHAHMGDELFTKWWLTGGFLGKLIRATNPAVYSAFGLFLFAVVVGALAWTRRLTPALSAKRVFLRDLSAGVTGPLIYLLSGPIVHAHYFVMAMPAVLYVLRPGLPHGGRSWGRWALGLSAFVLMAFHRTYRDWGWSVWPNHGLITFTGVWILFLMILYEWVSLLSVSVRLRTLRQIEAGI